MDPSVPPSTVSPVVRREPHVFACPGCGSALTFSPTRAALACAACGHVRPLPEPTADERDRAQREQDYLLALRRLAEREPSLEAQVVDCPSCGAQTRFDPHVVGDRCAFCATPLRRDSAHAQRMLQPQGLLAFALDAAAAQQVFARWVRSRWFAPNALKHTVSQADGIRGVYVPWWTYDATTVTRYSGERGTQRQVSEGPGKPTRTETDWTPVAGAVQVDFDDLLVAGSPSIPPHLARVLDRWDFAALRPPAPELQAGFTVEVYRRDLEQGFVEARRHMDAAIQSAIRADIGGSQQRVHAWHTEVDDLRFKHLLLPVWMGSYRFSGRAYQVVVNGQSGEVEGDRPYSWVNIGSLVLIGMLLALVWWQATAR